MSRFTRYAAAAVIIIAVLIGISQFGGSVDMAGVAWADVLEQISEVRPYACRMTFDFDGDRPDHSYRVFRKNLSVRREERDDGSIYIYDMSQKPVKTLVLYPDKKIAREEVLLDRGPLKDPDLLRMIAGRQNGMEEDLGLSEINGRTVKGFHSPDEHNEFTVWADVETNLPVRVELRQSSSGRTIIMEDFEFVVEFDESLFDTTAPEDYAVGRVERPGGGATIIKTEGVAEDVDFEFYVLSTAPAWGNEPRVLKVSNVMGLGDDIYMTCSLAEDGRHVVFMQSKMMSEMLLNKIRTGKHVYTSTGGLKVYRGGPEKWYSQILLESVSSMLPDKPSPDRIGCGIETTDEGVILLAINGPATDEELFDIVESLVGASVAWGQVAEPEEITAEDIRSKLNHAAYTVDKLAWAKKIGMVQTGNPLMRGQGKVYLTAILSDDGNVIVIDQSNMHSDYKEAFMGWILKEELVVEADSGAKLYTHPNGSEYARLLLGGFGKANPEFFDIKNLSEERFTRMIVMSDGTIMGLSANKAMSDKRLQELVESLIEIKAK